MGNAQQKIAGYLARGYQGGMHCNLIAVDEDYGTADAIRSISDRITVHDLLLSPEHAKPKLIIFLRLTLLLSRAISTPTWCLVNSLITTVSTTQP